MGDCCLTLLAILCPPAAVMLVYGCGVEFCLNLLLTLLGFIPGLFHALFLISIPRKRPQLVAVVPTQPPYNNGGYNQPPQQSYGYYNQPPQQYPAGPPPGTMPPPPQQYPPSGSNPPAYTRSKND